MTSSPQSFLVSFAFMIPRPLRHLLSVEADIVRKCLNKLNMYKSMRPDGMHPQVLKELANISVGPRSVIIYSKYHGDWGKLLMTAREQTPALPARRGKKRI